MYILTVPSLTMTITFIPPTAILFTGGRPMTWERTGRVSVPWWPRRPWSLHPAVHTVPSENNIVTVLQTVITNVIMIYLRYTVQTVPSENWIIIHCHLYPLPSSSSSAAAAAAEAAAGSSSIIISNNIIIMIMVTSSSSLSSASSSSSQSRS